MNKIIVKGQYRAWSNDYAAHLRSKGVQVEEFYALQAPRKMFFSKWCVVLDETISFLKLTFHLGKFRNALLVSVGGGNSCMLFYRLFGWLLGKDAHLYLTNYYLHGMSNRSWVRHVLRFLMNNNRLTYFYQTPKEKDFYRNLSQKVNLVFVPYCSDVRSFDNGVDVNNGYIFTGGYTNRDYSLMSELARRMPQKKFLFVASDINDELDPLPENVTLKMNVVPAEFERLMTEAGMVVVPLREDVGSSGQMLCLQAMRQHKPIVYADASSISYYFTSQSGVPYKIGSIDSLQKAVEQVLADATKAHCMGEQAYKESIKYTISCKMKILDEIILT